MELRKTFGIKTKEVAGEWRRLHNEELHNLYVSPDIVRVIQLRRMRWEGHVARVGEMRKAYDILVGKPEGKRSLGRPSRRCEGNIRMDLSERGWEDVHLIHVSQDRDQWRGLVNTVMNLQGI
jgi:hypothetical protein